MFGDYLKQLRYQLGLTQRELATKLNLANPEFSSVDSVTISRWERNATAPKTVKAIKVLRELTLDLRPFLLSLPSPENETFLDDIIYERYYSQKALLLSSGYEELKPQEEAPIIEEALFAHDIDTHLPRLHSHFIFIFEQPCWFDVGGAGRSSLAELTARQYPISINTFDMLFDRF